MITIGMWLNQTFVCGQGLEFIAVCVVRWRSRRDTVSGGNKLTADIRESLLLHIIQRVHVWTVYSHSLPNEKNVFKSKYNRAQRIRAVMWRSRGREGGEEPQHHCA